MGLDAVVFRNVKNLESRFGHGLFDVDQTTGEATPKENSRVKIPRDAYFAARERLGNLAEGGRLRTVVEKILGSKDALIARRVLHSGSHSGDSLKLDEYPQLRKEIDLLKAQGGADLKVFVGAMESLLVASESEHNPIVFS